MQLDLKSGLLNECRVENQGCPFQPVVITVCHLWLWNPGLDARGCFPEPRKEKVCVYWLAACYSKLQVD
jgi:hypothetical protein